MVINSSFDQFIAEIISFPGLILKSNEIQEDSIDSGLEWELTTLE